MTPTTQSPNRFCAPFALSRLAGVPLDQSVSLLQEDLGNIDIQGVFYPQILKILKQRGFGYRRLNLKRDYRLAEYLKKLCWGKERYPLLVIVPEHVGIIEHDKFYDNGNPQGTTDPPNWKIEQIYEVWNLDEEIRKNEY